MTKSPSENMNKCCKVCEPFIDCVYCRCHELAEKPPQGVRERLIEVFYRDFKNINHIDVKFEDVYEFFLKTISLTQKEAEERLRARILKVFKEKEVRNSLDYMDQKNRLYWNREIRSCYKELEARKVVEESL